MNGNFNQNHMPTSAAALGRQVAEEEKRQRELEAKEVFRESIIEQRNQKNFDLAKETKEINHQAFLITKKYTWVGVATLIVSSIGMVFAVLSYFKD